MLFNIYYLIQKKNTTRFDLVSLRSNFFLLNVCSTYVNGYTHKHIEQPILLDIFNLYP